jgi:hypothetical protein
MELLAKVKIENLFKAKDFTDKKSGETTSGKWKVQTFSTIETAEGNQMRLMDISIPEEMAKTLKDKVGQVVTIPVGTFINNGKVGYYGLSL